MTIFHRIVAKLLPTIKRFFGFDEENINDRYMVAIIATMMLFLSTQIFFSIQTNINIENVYVTIFSCISFTILYVLSRYKSLRNLTRWTFLIVSLAMIAGFWLTTEGLFGSIISYFPLAMFNFVAVMNRKYHFVIFGIFILTAALLFSIDLYKPLWIINYNSIEAKRTDVFSGMLFTSLLIATAFRYLKGEYDKNVLELHKQIEEQKRLNEELDNFVYRTSHDLRAPVSSSLGLIDLMEMNETSAENAKYLELQRKSLVKMDDFIRDILNYSRNSRLELMQDEIDFRALFDEAIQQIRFSNHAEDMHYLFENEGDIILKSDKMRWQVIFNNMVSNAYKYRNTQRKDAFLRVVIRKENEQVRIIFDDNGIGIDEQSLPKIFDMFYRASTKSVGSGVGLYIVKQAIIKLGGNIECHSILGKGTTFTIMLPIEPEK